MGPEKVIVHATQTKAKVKCSRERWPWWTRPVLGMGRKPAIIRRYARGRPGSRLAQIGFIHPASLGGMLIHLVEREEIS